jgi:ATP-dependent DNA helicase RecG
MEVSELIAELALGEDSTRQWKADARNADQLAAEMVALCNSAGGRIFIGVEDKTGRVLGLSLDDIDRIGRLVSDSASQNVKPPINPIIENVPHPDGIVMVLSVANGIAKPYMDNQGIIWVKNGPDKRRVTAREELQRMFQSAGLLHGDEVPANGLGASDIDLDYFKGIYERKLGESFDTAAVDLPRLLENMNLSKGGVLNVAGALLFAKRPAFRLPAFIVKAIHYPGNDQDPSGYLRSEDISGKLIDVFQRTVNFILHGLDHVQQQQSVNSVGEPEIPRIALEELVSNALVHRDYFISAPVRVFMYRDRVEIISPGHLPNNLTVVNVLAGNSNMRNPVLASFASTALPYRGMGTGVRRALNAYPHIRFKDDRANNQFIVTLERVKP